MAKPKKPKGETPPQVTDAQTPDDPVENLFVETDSDVDKSIDAEAVGTASDAELHPERDIELEDAPLKGPETTEAAAEQPESFARAETVEEHKPLDADESKETDESEKPVESQDASDPAPTQQPVPAEPPQKSIFWPAVFGGVIAAMLGFIAGRGDMLDAYFPRAALPEPVDLTPLTQETAALSARIGELEGAEPVDLTPGLDALSQSLDAVQSSVESLTTRLDDVEARPAPTTSEPQADNSEELAALQSAISELEARLAEEDARANTEAARLLAQAALTRVMTAVESGETFEPALGALEDVTAIEVPQALRVAAAEGVPNMAALRENFPDAARAGLAAARADVPESEIAGIGSFLRRQLSARSVTPREGTDPDAVLSRAEAALRLGDLETTLVELSALPGASKAAMQGWLEGAQARKNASDAAKALSDSLTVN